MTYSLNGLFRQADLTLALLPTLVAIALSLTACGQQDKPQPPPPRPVKFVTVSHGTQGESEALTGDIHAHDETSLGFRLDGRILTRLADVGDRVRSGDILATLENTTTDNAYRSAQSEVESARAAQRLASSNLHRMKMLMPSGAIARAQFDSAVSDQASAKAKLKSSEASLSSAHENINWTRLTSPADGIIIATSASAGQVITAGQTIFTLASGTGRDVIIDVPNPAVFSAPTNPVFHVSLLENPAITANARLRDISPQADQQTRTWRVRLTLENPPPAMMLGASVSVTLPDSTPPGIEIPASALTRIAGRPAVFVIDGSGSRLKRKSVVISRFSAADVYIQSGLIPGDRVVTAGVSLLREGEIVSAEEGRS
jgi:RND family efflux transporter MFP subunit